MGNSSEQRHLWLRVFVRAFDDALTVLGVTRRKAVVGMLTTSIAAAGLACLLGPDKATDKLIWAGLTLAASWILFAVIYTWFLLRTFFVLHAEEKACLKIRIGEVTAANKSLEADRNALSQELAKARRADPHANFQKKELEKLIDRFRGLIVTLGCTQHAAIEEFYSADLATKAFIDREFSSYTEYASTFPVRISHTAKAKYDSNDFNDLVRICEDRIARLEELLEHFH